MTEAVKVMVRCRPLNSSEKGKNCAIIVDVDRSRKEVSIKDPAEKDNVKTFTYDDVFPMDISQKAIYQASAFGIVENVVAGYNGTIFAYGQTGCGKTFSMMGDPRSEQNKGIIPRTFSQIMSVVAEKSDCQFMVRVSFLEIYNENIRDLLSDSDDKLEIKEDKDRGIFVQDLSKVTTNSVDDMLQVMFKGDKNRSVGATAMNQDSSRSHSLFTIYVEVSEKVAGAEDPKIRGGKLNLVDLAGSERQSKTQATGQRLEEAKKINLSLSALGNVISALVAGGKKHVPYRDSKLTRLLQDSLGGNTKTLMIAAISPADYNFEETIGTLKYASRAKQIQNKPKINEDPKDAMLKQMADELKMLRQQLEGAGGAVAPAKGRVSNEEAERKRRELEEQARRQAMIEGEHAEFENAYQKGESELAEQKRIREEMERKLAEIQAKVAGGNKQKPVISKEEMKQYDEMKQEVEMHEIEEQELIQSQVQETKRNAKKNAAAFNDNFDEMSEEYAKLQKKYKQMCRDLRDAQHENIKEKEEIMDSIRGGERELDFMRQIISVLLSKDELDQIRNESRWDEEREDWIIPKFDFTDAAKGPSRQQVQAAYNPRDKERSNKSRGGDSSAVSPQPSRDSPNKAFRVKNGTGTSREVNVPNLRSSNQNQLPNNFDDDVLDGKESII
jgi:hypothetical protein